MSLPYEYGINRKGCESDENEIWLEKVLRFDPDAPFLCQSCGLCGK